MYKVMLVDDEKLILQGVRHIIEWEELGFNVVHLAKDGQEALEKFKEDPVDIIVTDINMPRLSGLELVKEIKELNNKVKFIILSGYDEFAYARTAINLGVENYILKPINEEELQASVIDIKNKLDSEKNKENTIYAKHRAIVKLINGDFDKENLEKINELINLDMKSQSYSVSLIDIRNTENIDYSHRLGEIIKRNTIGKYEIKYYLSGCTILINSWSDSVTTKEVKGYCNSIIKKLLDEVKVDVFVSVGTVVNSLYDLNTSYKVAKNLRKYTLVKDVNTCVCEDDIKGVKENKRNFTKEIDKLNKYIIEKNSKEIEPFINKIFDYDKLTPENIYDLSLKTLILIDSISNEFKIGKKYSGDSLVDTIVELCAENTRDSIKALLISEAKELIENMNPTAIKYSPVVQQIISHVNEKYYEDLSLKTLGYQYNINTSYLGQVFTKEVGCSFSEYLNKTKNMKAKELILNTNMKINDIAKEVGYLDTSYFYRKFKKYYGVCPSTLREIKNY